MTPKLAEIADALHRSRSGLLEPVAELDQESFDRIPGEGRWSIGEILDHVYRAERGVVKLFNLRLPEALANGLDPDPTPEASLLGQLNDPRLTDRTRKIEAPGFVVPRPGRPRDELLEELAATRASLLAAIAEAGDRDLSGIIHPHPVLGPIDLYQWLLFCHYHEVRHTGQLAEVIEQLAETPPA